MSKVFVLFAFLVLFLTEIIAQPVASFNVNYTEVCAPANIVCTNTTTNCTGAIAHYWSIIGSPDVSSNQDAVFFFPSGGTYTIILQETCAEGTDTYEMVITVYDGPRARFDNTLMTGCMPFYASFTDLTVPGDGTDLTYTWYFGDGLTSTDQNPTHTYNAGGSYNVSLIVEDENGCTSDTTALNVVQIANDPAVSFVADVPTMCVAPHTVNFTSNVTTSFGLNATYAWDFGDVSPISCLPNPSHQYSSGVYDVSLTVTDEYGCQSILVKNDYIQVVTVTPEYSVAEGDTVYIGNEVHFVNETIFSCLWDFGDGGTSSQNTPVHVYNQNGEFVVSFTIDPGGPCAYQSFFTITVVAEPSINFIIFPASGPTNADGYVEVNIVGGVPPFDVNCSSAKSEYDIDNLAPGNYVLSVEDANGHTASVQFEMTWTTGIIPIEFTDSFYPNPASEFIIIQSANNSLASMEIIDLNGKILLRKDFISDNEVVDVTSLENGIYLVRTYNEGYSRITKLLICR